MDDPCGICQHLAHTSFSSEHAGPLSIGARELDGLPGTSAPELLVTYSRA